MAAKRNLRRRRDRIDEERLNSAEGKWLPFLGTYRTMCLAPPPEFRRVLEELNERLNA